MGYHIKVSQQAERDLQTAKCFFGTSGIETDFDTDFLHQVEYLKINPFLFQVYYRNVRRCHFKKFNYSIHYLIEDTVVYILRILHHGQYYE